MAARKAKNVTDVEALEKELEQLQQKLFKAHEDQLKQSDSMTNKLRRGLEAARKKEQTARDRVAKARAKKKTQAQQRQLETARQKLAEARAQTDSLKQEMIAVQADYKGFKADHKRAAERAKVIAKHTAAYDKKAQAAEKAKARKATAKRKTAKRTPRSKAAV